VSVAWLLCILTPEDATASQPGVDSRVPPNIILMMADDMGLGDTSAYQDFTGNSDKDQIHTPAMAQLAAMGVRFTDAHTPSSRCTPTRYGLLTGRYPWRNRLKHWVLFGAQGDPLIEADRPTIATMLKDNGYRTGMVGKWHVGLRYRRADGQPAAGWDDADLTQLLFDCPLDHGFDFCRFTSRSHGTSGAQPGRRNKPEQSIGPGHIHGRTVVSATENAHQLAEDGPNAYVLSELGGRHFDNAHAFLNEHISGSQSSTQPFFLYYACNSNHSPYTPDTDVAGQPVAGAARNRVGEPVDRRGDFVYENDVALAGLLNYLRQTQDPRRPGHPLIDNTIVIFTSDNGAERDANTATGPFRSNKGSVYEGGHRVPFIIAWGAGGIGDGNETTPGRTSESLIGLQDVYATLAEINNIPLPNSGAGEKGAEDSLSFLAACRGDSLPDRPMFYNDHKQAEDHAAVAMRLDNPTVNDKVLAGQWKVLFDAALLRQGRAQAMELYNLAVDPAEQQDLLHNPDYRTLIDELSAKAMLHRNCGGHRLSSMATTGRIRFDWQASGQTELPGGGIQLGLKDQSHGQSSEGIGVSASDVTMSLTAVRGNAVAEADRFDVNQRGLGVSGGTFAQVDDGEALIFQFDRDVIVESAEIVAGNGICGGFYTVGDQAPLAIYCVDADNDAQDQSGILSDIGVVKAGQSLRLDSSPHFGTEAAGRWRLKALTIRVIAD
jgi:arylsulfatase A